MANKLEEMLAFRTKVNQMLEDHTSALSRHIDALFEEAMEQMKSETKGTTAPSSLRDTGVADSRQSPNHATVHDPNASGTGASGGEEPHQTGRYHGTAFISEADMEKFVSSKPSMWKGFSIQWPVEPTRAGYLAELVNSKKFDAITVAVIFAHVVFTIIETNWQMKHRTLATTTLMLNIEITFTCAYVVELALRLAVHRLYFFCNNDMTWNVLDLIIVLASIVDSVASFVKTIANMGNPSFLRFFRILRVAKKLLRVVRLLQFFSELRLMIRCVLGSARALFWCFMMLLGFAVVFSILIVQQFTIFLADSGGDIASSFVLETEAHFGSIWSALLTLFMSISGGKDWGPLYQLVKETGFLNAAFFLIYILFVWLSITNIVISIFCEKALKLAQPDIDESLLARRKADLKKVREIKNFFRSLDLNKSGTLSYEELQNCMLDVRSVTYFEMMELDIKDAEAFFSMLTSLTGQTEVDVHGFVSGWLKMKGPATSLDVYTVQFQTQQSVEVMLRELARCRENMMQLHQEVIRGNVAHSPVQDNGHTGDSAEVLGI